VAVGALREGALPGGRRKYVHVASGPVPYWAMCAQA